MIGLEPEGPSVTVTPDGRGFVRDRQHRRRVLPRQDYLRSREASRAVEPRYGLTTTAPVGGTSTPELPQPRNLPQLRKRSGPEGIGQTWERPGPAAQGDPSSAWPSRTPQLTESERAAVWAATGAAVRDAQTEVAVAAAATAGRALDEDPRSRPRCARRRDGRQPCPPRRQPARRGQARRPRACRRRALRPGQPASAPAPAADGAVAPGRARPLATGTWRARGDRRARS